MRVVSAARTAAVVGGCHGGGYRGGSYSGGESRGGDRRRSGGARGGESRAAATGPAANLVAATPAVSRDGGCSGDSGGSGSAAAGAVLRRAAAREPAAQYSGAAGAAAGLPRPTATSPSTPAHRAQPLELPRQTATAPVLWPQGAAAGYAAANRNAPQYSGAQGAAAGYAAAFSWPVRTCRIADRRRLWHAGSRSRRGRLCWVPSDGGGQRQCLRRPRSRRQDLLQRLRHVRSGLVCGTPGRLESDGLDGGPGMGRSHLAVGRLVVRLGQRRAADLLRLRQQHHAIRAIRCTTAISRSPRRTSTTSRPPRWPRVSPRQTPIRASGCRWESSGSSREPSPIRTT